MSSVDDTCQSYSNILEYMFTFSGIEVLCDGYAQIHKREQQKSISVRLSHLVESLFNF